MFTKPLTRVSLIILIKSFFFDSSNQAGRAYLHDLSHMFLKRLKLLCGEIAGQKRFVFYS